MDILHRQAAGRQKQSDEPKHIATHCNEAMSRDAAMSQRFGLKNQRQPPASTSTSTLVLTRVHHTVAASHTTALKTRTRGTPTQELLCWQHRSNYVYTPRTRLRVRYFRMLSLSLGAAAPFLAAIRGASSSHTHTSRSNVRNVSQGIIRACRAPHRQCGFVHGRQLPSPYSGWAFGSATASSLSHP